MKFKVQVLWVLLCVACLTSGILGTSAWASNLAADTYTLGEMSEAEMEAFLYDEISIVKGKKGDIAKAGTPFSVKELKAVFPEAKMVVEDVSMLSWYENWRFTAHKVGDTKVTLSFGGVQHVVTVHILDPSAVAGDTKALVTKAMGDCVYGRRGILDVAKYQLTPEQVSDIYLEVRKAYGCVLCLVSEEEPYRLSTNEAGHVTGIRFLYRYEAEEHDMLLQAYENAMEKMGGFNLECANYVLKIALGINSIQEPGEALLWDWDASGCVELSDAQCVLRLALG